MKITERSKLYSISNNKDKKKTNRASKRMNESAKELRVRVLKGWSKEKDKIRKTKTNITKKKHSKRMEISEKCASINTKPQISIFYCKWSSSSTKDN